MRDRSGGERESGCREEGGRTRARKNRNVNKVGIGERGGTSGHRTRLLDNTLVGDLSKIKSTQTWSERVTSHSPDVDFPALSWTRV